LCSLFLLICYFIAFVTIYFLFKFFLLDFFLFTLIDLFLLLKSIVFTGIGFDSFFLWWCLFFDAPIDFYNSFFTLAFSFLFICFFFFLSSLDNGLDLFTFWDFLLFLCYCWVVILVLLFDFELFLCFFFS
jgi:hypothetical protein